MSNKTAKLLTATQPGPRATSPAKHSEYSAAEVEPAYKSGLDIHPVQIHIERGWTAAKDREYFDYIWGADIKDKDRCPFMLARIGENLHELGNTLDQAALFLSDGGMDPGVLDLLSIADKVVLLRKLFVEHLPQVPSGHQRNYLFRFNEHLDQCEQIEALRRTVLLKFLLNRSNTWLSELVHLADWIATAQIEFKEGMDCEHGEFRSWRQSSPAATRGLA
jgi:hypothetical protein